MSAFFLYHLLLAFCTLLCYLDWTISAAREERENIIAIALSFSGRKQTVYCECRFFLLPTKIVPNTISWTRTQTDQRMSTERRADKQKQSEKWLICLQHWFYILAPFSRAKICKNYNFRLQTCVLNTRLFFIAWIQCTWKYFCASSFLSVYVSFLCYSFRVLLCFSG